MISCGDLIDRGSDSPSCLDLINKNWFYTVKGNHEDIFYHDYLDFKKTNFHYPSTGIGNEWAHDYFKYLISRSDESIIRELEKLPYIIDLNVRGERFFVVHGSLAHINRYGDLDFISDVQIDSGIKIEESIVSNESLSVDRMEDPVKHPEHPFYVDGVPVLKGHSITFCGHTVMPGTPLLSKSHLAIDTGAVIAHKDEKHCLTAIEISPEGKKIHQVSPIWGCYTSNIGPKYI